MRRHLPQAILFDWDNTLVDSWDVIHHALEATFLAMGATPWTPAETRARVRYSAREAFPGLFGERAEEAAGIFYRSFEALHLKKLKPSPGAARLLHELSGMGLDLAVVSNKTGRYLREEAQHLGWSGYFRKLIGATDAEVDKPAPEVVDLALVGGRAEHGPRSDVWFVGDTDIDLRCAVNAGCVPVLLRREPPGDDEFLEYRPRLHVPTCEALLGLLKMR